MGTKQKFDNTSRGFTLIELLVVVAIIGLLTSIIIASLSTARAKARDSKAVSEFIQVKTALALYYDKYNRYPNETPVTNGSDQWWGNFNSMAAQLVTEGFLGAVPVAPANHIYHYYNYGVGGLASPEREAGAIVITILETAPNTITGISPSCRPWSATGSQWCEKAPSKYYCVCNPY